MGGPTHSPPLQSPQGIGEGVSGFAHPLTPSPPFIVDDRTTPSNCQLLAETEDTSPFESREKFVDLAEKRVSRALKDIKLIGNLSNRTNYSYTEQDAKKIVSVLKKAVDEMKARFDSRGNSADETFKL